MTNIVGANKGVKEVQVTIKSQSKSSKVDFKALFNLETEALKTDGTGVEEKAANGIGVDGEKEIEEPDQEIIDEEPDENHGEMIQFSCLIQGNPPLKIKNSVPSFKSSVDAESSVPLVAPAGIKVQETPLNQWIKESLDAVESVSAEEAGASKAEALNPGKLQNPLPEEVKETEGHKISDDVTETKSIEALPEKQIKSDAIRGTKNKPDLEQQQIQGNPAENKEVLRIAESLKENNLSSPFGDKIENDTSREVQKTSQSDRLEDFPFAIKASEFQKGQTPSSPEVTRVLGENLDLATKEILHQMETLTDGHKTMVNLKLNPEELGEMEISLSMENGRLTGKIVVGNKEIQQIFSDKLHELNQTLKENRIDVASFEVKISSDQNQNQEQARQQGRRAMDYPGRFNSQRNSSTQTEEWIRPANTSDRGIDILA